MIKVNHIISVPPMLINYNDQKEHKITLDSKTMTYTMTGPYLHRTVESTKLMELCFLHDELLQMYEKRMKEILCLRGAPNESN